LKALLNGNGGFMINDTGIVGSALLARGDDQIMCVIVGPFSGGGTHVQMCRSLRKFSEDCTTALSGDPIGRKEIAKLLPKAAEQSSQMPDRLAVACEGAGRERLGG